MKNFDILLQGEGIADIQLVILPESAHVADVVNAARTLSGIDDGEFFVFLQDEEAPLAARKPLPHPKPGIPLCLHVHRCKQIKVSVTFNGRSETIQVAPGRAIGALKTAIAVKLFGMDPADAAEHVLQLAGSNERPDPDTHVGALAHHCALTLDLVPLVRVEG